MTDEQTNNQPELEDTLRLVSSKNDPTADGLFRRLLIGGRGEDISGAIYLKPGVRLPKAIIVRLDV